MKLLDCMNIYEDAEFYDQEFAHSVHEIPFYLKQAKLAGDPVLEVACGTGRLTLPLAKEGVGITGLDISGPMLERARHKAGIEGLSIVWLQQDCRQITVDRNFALIFSAANAMQHLLDLDSVNAFLQSARQALQPDGTLILDVFNPDPLKLARTADTHSYLKTFNDMDGNEIRVETVSGYDRVGQILDFTLFYLRKNVLIKTKHIQMRCFFAEELLYLCRLNGLKVMRRVGDYDESSFDNNSPKQIIFCSLA